MLEFHLSKKFKNRRVKTRFSEDIEPQEIILDRLAQRKEKEIGVSEKKFETPISNRAFQGIWLVFLALISFFFFLTFQMQVLNGKDLLARAQDNKFIIYSIQAARGVIYDSRGNRLVSNEPSFDLVFDKSERSLSQDEKLKAALNISKIIKRDSYDLVKLMSAEESPIALIYQDLDYQTLIVLETRIGEFPGFKIVQNWLRNYKDAQDFSHLIGYTGRITTSELKEFSGQYSVFDWVGKNGLEKAYENVLRKNPGKLRVEKDARGNLISKETVQLPESGSSLVLWLDSELQKKIREILERNLSRVGSQKGAAIALDPKTGGVLAMVSLPGFDNNLFQKGSDQKSLKALLEDPLTPLFNRVIAGQYPSGSTIKPLIASAVLEEKIISPEKKIYDPGFIEVPHKYDPEIVYKFLDWKVHGWTDMRAAIAESCNVYFYTVGGGYKNQEGLGPTRIKKYLELFGWNQKTQIDLPGETSGFLPSPEWKENSKKEKWWDGDTYHFSIGQGDVLVSPVQMAASFAAIANDGKLLKPQSVKTIIDSRKNIVEEMTSQIIRENFISPENLQIVREGMRQGVTSSEGSSFILNSLPVKVAAKTGTAETGEKNNYDTWIAVFAPYEDPEIVLVLMMEDVKGLGQLTVLPAAKEILEWYFSR